MCFFTHYHPFAALCGNFLEKNVAIYLLYQTFFVSLHNNHKQSF